MAKIPASVVEAIRLRIEPLDTPEQRENYRAGNFPRSASVNDLDRRYRWDLFWASRSNDLLDYSGLKDAHIDTALRSVVPPLGKEAGYIEPDSLVMFTILATVIGTLAYFGWHILKAGAFWT